MGSSETEGCYLVVPVLDRPRRLDEIARYPTSLHSQEAYP